MNDSPPLRQGTGAGSRLHLRQRADGLPRAHTELIAPNVGDGQVSALRKFINVAPWDFADVQAVFADEPVPTAAGRPVGVVGVIDESGFSKKGDHSAGAARQHNGRLGKEDNRQVGVYLVGVTPGGSAPPDHRLYLPESWCEDTEACEERRDKVHIPEDVAFQTEPQIAAGLIRRSPWTPPLRAGSQPTRSTGATASSSASRSGWNCGTWSRCR